MDMRFQPADLVMSCLQEQGEEFLQRFPGILNVADFIHGIAETNIRVRGRYTFYQKLGGQDICGYLGCLNEVAVIT